MPQNEDMKTEFTNAAEAAEFEKYRQMGMQAQQTLAAPTTQPGAPSAVGAPAADPAAAKKPEWVKDAVPEASKIMEAGRKAKGLPDDWQPTSAGLYGGLKEADDVFRAGLEATGSTAFEYNMGQFRKAAGMAKDGSVAVGKDLGRAISNPGNTLQQIPSGLLNAWNEINQFGTSLDVTAAKLLADTQVLADAAGIPADQRAKPYYPALQITDPNTGKIDVKFVNLVEKAVQDRMTAEGPLQVESPFEDPVSVTGGIVEVVSQFAAPYGTANKALKTANILANPGAWNTAGRATLAGYMTDFAAFDPEMGRVTDLAAQMGIEGEWVDYLKSNPDDSEIENRFKNALEGLGLNVATEALFAVFRGTKGVKTLETELGARIEELQRADADAAARFEEDIYATGRPDEDSVIITPPPRAQTAAAQAAAVPPARADLEAELDGLLKESRAARESGDPAALKAVEDKIDANLQARIKETMVGQREPIAGERYLEQDFFELQRGDTGGAKFAMGDPPRNKDQFLAEEVVARQGEQGDIVGFRMTAGDVGVMFDRLQTTTAINWDWLDNLATGTAFRGKNLTLSQANEVVSKIMAIVEADAKNSGTPTYYFAGRTDALSRVYAKLVPRLADRIGFRAEVNSDGAILMTRKSIAPMIDTMRGLMADPPVSAGDRAARAQKRQAIQQEINAQSGFAPQFGRENDRQAAAAMAAELDARGAKFSSQQGTGRTERTFMQRQNQVRKLREESRRVFGKHFEALEETGRIQFARKASDIDPNWKNRDETAQGVTMPGGKVFIFSDVVEPEDMYGLILHEAGIHSGLRGMIGDKGFQAVLGRVKELAQEAEAALENFGRDALSADERLYADSIAKARATGDDLTDDQILEEALGYIVQNGSSSARGFHAATMETIVASVKAWLVKTFPGLTERLNLNRADFDALALSAIRSEAIVAGRLIGMFGRGAKMRAFPEYMQDPIDGPSGKKVLGEQDRLDQQPEVRLIQNTTADVPDAELSTQVRLFQDDMLHGRVIDFLFRNMPEFDPFTWRDAVDLVSQGQATRDQYRMVRRALDSIQNDPLGPNFEYRNFMEISSPPAMQFWNDVRSKSDKPTTMVLSMDQRIFGEGAPDDAGFITTAERAIDNLGGQFRDAQALTADQWRKALRSNGVTGEAFRFQVEPALESIGRGTGDITRDELKEAMARVRPEIQTKSGRKTSVDNESDGWRTVEEEAPIATSLLNVQEGYGGFFANTAVRLMPKPLQDRVMAWAQQAVEDMDDKIQGFDNKFAAKMGERDYSDYVSPGRVEGYEQELIIAPNEAKGYRSHNWNTEGVVGHIRTTDRRTAKGERVLYVDELQSDLHQDAAKGGYAGSRQDPAVYRNGLVEKADTAAARLKAYEEDLMRASGADPADPLAQRPMPIDDPKYMELDREASAAKEALRDFDDKGVDSLDAAPPRAPMKDWEKPFIRRVLQKAAKGRVSLVAFTNFETLNNALKSGGSGVQKFYNDRLPVHITDVAKELGLKVEKVEMTFGELVRPGPVSIEALGSGRGFGFKWTAMDGSKYAEEGFDSKEAAQARIKVLRDNQKSKVMAIRLTPEAVQKVGGGVPMFSMKEAPGRMDEALQRTVLQDIKDGRRALDPAESEALLGAAERWAKAVAALQPSQARTFEDIIEVARSRADPQAMRELIQMMEIAKANVPEPPSLLTFLRRKGGLKEMVADYAGELRNRDLQTVNLVNNRSGRDLDEAAELAWEAGYIGQSLENDVRATIDDLLEAIDKEMTGEKVYSSQDFNWVAEAATRKDMREELMRLGIDPATSKKSIMSEFERISSIQEGEPLTLRDFENNTAAEKAANAQPGIGLPAKGLLGGNEIRINFNAIQAEDDIRSILGQLADAFKTEILAARGSRPLDTVIRDARRKSAWDALNDRREGVPLADSEVLAAQSLYVTSAENVKQALDFAMKQGTDTAHYNARRAITLHRAIQAEIAGAKADASRALRAWGIPRAGTAQARRELNQVLADYGGQLDPVEAARLRTMLDAEPEAADKAIRSMGSKVSDVGGTILRFAWLSGPQTHIMNMAGNSLTTVFDIGMRLATGVRGKVLGDPILERELGAALKEYTGLMVGVRSQFASFARQADYKKMGQRLAQAQQKAKSGDYKGALKQGASAIALDNPISATFRGRFDDRGVSGAQKYGAQGSERAVSAEAFGMKRGTVQSTVVDGIGALLSAPTDFLGFQDDFFKGVNELAARYREAERMVQEEMAQGLPRDQYETRFAEIVNDPPQSILDEARLTAQRRTFTEPVGAGTRMLLTARDYMNKLGFPMGHILLPFIVTPSNILKFAFQNGPTGLLFREIQDDLKAGGTRAALAQSRMAAGTGLLLIGMDLVAHGFMTGRGPTDPGERELWEREGKQEYSVKVGDKWVQYRRLEPVSTMLAIGADLQTIFLNSELDDSSDTDLAEIIGPVVGSAIQVVTSKTYLTSAAEFVRFTEDPQRYGSSYIERLFASVGAPALTAQIEEVQDPVIREASNVVERWMSRMPGFSKDLPPSLDIWGRKRSVSSGMGQVYDTLSPFSVKTQDPEPIDQELSRIGFYPRRPDKAITVQTPEGISVSVNLRNRPDIWTRYVQLAGGDPLVYQGSALWGGLTTKEYLNAVIEKRHPDSADYHFLPDSQTMPVSKEWFINRTIERARLVARAKLQQEFRADLQAMAVAATRAERAAELRREELVPK